MHDVPAAGAETELDRGGVHHDRIAERDRSGELRQRVRALGPVTEIDLDALQPGALLEQPPTTFPVRNDGTLRRYDGCRRRHRLAIRRSTRSSRDLNGSLQSTVRCAWSLSFRCTQSTV